ncbi:MAG: histidine phosphatase family protein [Candidatus Thorarchaeota archaeon]
MKVVLVRHGQSLDNETGTISGHAPTPLSDLGKEQAKALGQKLLEMGIKFDAVYSSDIRRAFQTTSIICRELGIEEIIYDERLREGNAGVFTGKRYDTLTEEERTVHDLFLVDLDSKPSGGESVNEQMMRTKEGFHEIVSNHPEESTILVVGHGGTLFHILRNTLNLLPERDEWFGNCKLNIVERKNLQSEWKLTMLDNIRLGV